MKRIGAILLGITLSLEPLGSLFAADTMVTAADLAARNDWGPVLTTIGVQPGVTLGPDAYNALIRKLVTLPSIATKIRQASPRPITLQEWTQILRGLGITPKPVMSDSDWAAILSKAGVDVSKGVSPTLAQALPPTPLPPVITSTSTPSAPPPVIVISPSTSTVTASAPAFTVSIGTSAATPVVSTAAVSAVAPSSTTVVSISTAPAAMAAAAPTISTSSETLAAMAASTTVPVGVSVSTGVPEAKVSAPIISLDLHGMDINEVLKIFAKQGQLNFVTGSNVHGSVTISLKNVDLWEALRLVLESNDLAYAYDGQVVRILTSTDYDKMYGERFDDKTTVETVALQNVRASAMSKYLDSLKSRVGKILVYDYNNTLILMDTPESIKRMKSIAHQLDGELQIKVYALNYAQVEDLQPKILSLVTKEIGDIEIDKRTNRMVIMDFPDHFPAIDAVVAAFDRKHRSVLIEAKIIQITLKKDFDLGVDWQYVFNNFAHRAIAGGAQSAFNFSPIPAAAGTQLFTATLGTLQDNNYSVILQALDSVGKTNLLSAPRITTLNNETANILVGTREAYVTTTVTTPGGGAPSTTAEQINFVDVGVKLHVTPTIGEDDYITLRIKPEVSSVDRTITTAQGNVIPIVRTSQAETSVLVHDGETILMAGLIESTVNKTKMGIPFLSRIPILGIPFRSEIDSDTKTDITILLTSHIMQEDDAVPPVAVAHTGKPKP